MKTILINSVLFFLLWRPESWSGCETCLSMKTLFTYLVPLCLNFNLYLVQFTTTTYGKNKAFTVQYISINHSTTNVLCRKESASVRVGSQSISASDDLTPPAGPLVGGVQTDHCPQPYFARRRRTTLGTFRSNLSFTNSYIFC